MGVTGGPSTSIKVAWLRLFFPLDDTHSSGYSGVVRFVPPGQYPFDNALKRGGPRILARRPRLCPKGARVLMEMGRTTTPRVWTSTA
ncbi:hypothetical protein Y032_0093g2620 [Ancylostoma ceylanicum]|uniref:Uncharacterized protein n=1 Tax=Ancylostoma ceylanicum TaxID=53326 RepID=A0A016TLD5_9BILA|nr:hypothetical protein Y032_0093g2620 [Ancylostoma ceylanicum]